MAHPSSIQNQSHHITSTSSSTGAQRVVRAGVHHVTKLEETRTSEPAMCVISGIKYFSHSP
eukprot:723229-Rhodomonas_salina.3